MTTWDSQMTPKSERADRPLWSRTDIALAGLITVFTLIALAGAVPAVVLLWKAAF